MPLGRAAPSSNTARDRLLADRHLRPLAEQRAALAILTRRLDAASRFQLLPCLAERVRTDRRFIPALGALMRRSLDS